VLAPVRPYDPTRHSRNQAGFKFRKLEPFAKCVQRPMDIDREAHREKYLARNMQKSYDMGSKVLRRLTANGRSRTEFERGLRRVPCWRPQSEEAALA